MKAKYSLVALLLAPQFLFAQTGVVARHPANPQGKDFTMEVHDGRRYHKPECLSSKQLRKMG